MQRIARSVQHATYNTQRTPCNVQHATYNMRRTTPYEPAKSTPRGTGAAPLTAGAAQPSDGTMLLRWLWQAEGVCLGLAMACAPSSTRKYRGAPGARQCGTVGCGGGYRLGRRSFRPREMRPARERYAPATLLVEVAGVLLAYWRALHCPQPSQPIARSHRSRASPYTLAHCSAAQRKAYARPQHRSDGVRVPQG
jgi:hypothetical protein